MKKTNEYYQIKYKSADFMSWAFQTVSKDKDIIEVWNYFKKTYPFVVLYKYTETVEVVENEDQIKS